ncbi:MAG TPA: FAD-dependent monooxygenase, partial [Rhodanobacteraceae bacterium]|nr:FAD-dependent monooxygenase [Rhodanobacteraceae bacterium]
ALDAHPGRSRFAMEPNALHIWPRGNYMCIALPNAEGSFTVTLFLANASRDAAAPSFATLSTAAAVRNFFEHDFADAVPLMPEYLVDFLRNPTGLLGTLYLDRWHLGGRALLVGDAAHAIVPFHGQGMNCGFEDAVELADLLSAAPDDAAAVFAEFQRRRKPNALHIWPRGNYMCIALPNAEGSFTVTLFLSNHAKGGAPGFDSLDSPQAVREFFARDFADAVPLMPDYEHDFAANPTGLLGTLYLDRWHIDGRALLLGDAAHAIVPFHGQGMNCGFEDAVELADLMDDATTDATGVFAEFQRRRKPNADAIAAMALENYVEMRDSVADARFLLMRALERTLAARHPGRFVPRYWMVTFSRLPYATAFARGEVQAAILRELTAGKTALDEIDLDQADALVAARLLPLG